MTKAGEQVAALFAVAPWRETVEAEAIDQQVRDLASCRLTADVAIEFFIDDWNFIILLLDVLYQ